MGFKTIYAVSRGVYDDYSILCTFENEGDASMFQSLNSESYVEKLTMYEKGTKPEQLIIYKAEVVFLDNFKVDKIREWNYTIWDFESELDEQNNIQIRYTRSPILRDLGGFLRIKGLDQLEVNRAMADHMIRFIERSWIPQEDKFE